MLATQALDRPAEMHYEFGAGLRTGQLDNPYSEEANRVIAGHLASLHMRRKLPPDDDLFL